MSTLHFAGYAEVAVFQVAFSLQPGTRRNPLVQRIEAKIVEEQMYSC
jgi:hypothetical protein